ncbi:MAG: prepilin-type N-terminal cleavage/methylation domain-containing protein [Candidatus Kaiserbacteria bacterium]|nr:prepilin-type N-terminal cleavage/methylation domain-containing protein [Candidatus Kaiserbacteria bacterium]
MFSYPKRGFSLIEITIAIAIIGVMIVATSSFLARIPANGREVRDQDLALKIARSEIETLRALGYDALPLSGPFTDTLLGSLASSSASIAITAFNAKTKQVTASVTWRGASSSTRSTAITTLITQNSGLK